MVVAAAEVGEVADLGRDVRQVAGDPENTADPCLGDRRGVGHPGDHADPVAASERDDDEPPDVVRGRVGRPVVEADTEGHIEGYLDERHGVFPISSV